MGESNRYTAAELRTSCAQAMERAGARPEDAGLTADGLVAADLRETGFITLSEWAYAIHRSGLTIAEVPTVFINRRLGESNMSAAEAVGAIRALLRMRLRRTGS